jgi:hypothetical protein
VVKRVVRAAQVRTGDRLLWRSRFRLVVHARERAGRVLVDLAAGGALVLLAMDPSTALQVDRFVSAAADDTDDTRPTLVHSTGVW